MKYLALVYGNESADLSRPKEEQEKEMQAYFSFTEEIGKAGIMVAGEALHPTSTATTVRIRDGKLTTTDGPFAETREQLGGYYVLECSNLDEAIQWASKIPHAGYGSIEVRPIVDFSQMASA
ncbi:MAG TPA: YciI family protein [Bryobacteraceae bacterium]|nr:YciI family protein [Bryobacteraceae bacterium]